MTQEAAPAAYPSRSIATICVCWPASSCDRGCRANSIPPTLFKRRFCAHEKREQFRGKTDAEFAAWLRRILATKLAEAARHFSLAGRDLALERSLEEALQGSSIRLEAWLATDSDSPSQKAAHHEDLLRLSHALSQLSEDQRTALEMKYLEGTSLEAISHTWGGARQQLEAFCGGA